MKILFLYAFLVFTSCQVENKTNEEVLARVGDETLTKETLLLLAGGQASDAGVFSRLLQMLLKMMWYLGGLLKALFFQPQNEHVLFKT